MEFFLVLSFCSFSQTLLDPADPEPEEDVGEAVRSRTFSLSPFLPGGLHGFLQPKPGSGGSLTMSSEQLPDLSAPPPVSPWASRIPRISRLGTCLVDRNCFLFTVP